MKDWIQTYTGRKFFPTHPNIADLDIRDIAHALSMSCRFGGHVNKFYSVAEHCVRVSRRVEQITVDNEWPAADILYNAQWALIHDAGEAYLNDIPTPLKNEPAMVQYRVAEDVLMTYICAWLGLRSQFPPLVRCVDQEILGTEAVQLKAPVHPEWALQFPNGRLPDEIPGLTLGWDPGTAKKIFLDRFERLFGPKEQHFAGAKFATLKEAMDVL